MIKLNPYRVRVLDDVKMHFNVMQAYIYCRCVIEQPTIYLKSNREPFKTRYFEVGRLTVDS
jgi:hypothetical protein